MRRRPLSNQGSKLDVAEVPEEDREVRKSRSLQCVIAGGARRIASRTSYDAVTLDAPMFAVYGRGLIVFRVSIY